MKQYNKYYLHTETKDQAMKRIYSYDCGNGVIISGRQFSKVCADLHKAFPDGEQEEIELQARRIVYGK